jgi:hypothetical protein
MFGLLRKAAPAVVALVLGFGVGRSPAATVNIAGGASADVGGWLIAPDLGASLTGVSFDSTTDIVSIQNKSETISGGSAPGISFTQLSSDAATNIELATETIRNSTGSDWTGYQFSLSGSALFGSVTEVFASPAGTGIDYISATLSLQHMVVSYIGDQLNGATANWGGSSADDDLLIDASTSPEAPFAAFSLAESPQSSDSEVVPLPSAVWQILIGLLTLAFIPSLRKAVKVLA